MPRPICGAAKPTPGAACINPFDKIVHPGNSNCHIDGVGWAGQFVVFMAAHWSYGMAQS